MRGFRLLNDAGEQVGAGVQFNSRWLSYLLRDRSAPSLVDLTTLVAEAPGAQERIEGHILEWTDGIDGHEWIRGRRAGRRRLALDRQELLQSLRRPDAAVFRNRRRLHSQAPSPYVTLT